MTPERIVFCGCDAYVGRIDTERRVGLWPCCPFDNDGKIIDPRKMITVDLSRDPNAARANEIDWSEVEVDEHAIFNHGGLTSIGPYLPNNNHVEPGYVGGVYLEQGFMQRIWPDIRPTLPPKPPTGEAYEYQVILYPADSPNVQRRGMRYYGFHAEVIDVIQENQVRLKIWNAGRSKTSDTPLTTEIDLSSILVLSSADLNRLGSTGKPELRAAKGSTGPIFIEYIYATGTDPNQLGLRSPKIPASEDVLVLRSKTPAQPHLNVTANPDAIIRLILNRLKTYQEFAGDALQKLGDCLNQTAKPIAGSSSTRTLDLIDHARDGVLLFGNIPIDFSDPRVVQVFTNLAQGGALAQAGVNAIRLLGCYTAMSQKGQSTIRELSKLTKLAVDGTVDMLTWQNFNADGLDPKYAEVLLCSQDNLPPIDKVPWPPRSIPLKDAPTFGVAELPALSQGTLAPVSWPVVWADAGAALASDLNHAIGAKPGFLISGLLILPGGEIRIKQHDGVVRVQLLAGAQLVRVFPKADEEAVYRVDDPKQLEDLFAQLTARQPSKR